MRRLALVIALLWAGCGEEDVPEATHPVSESGSRTPVLCPAPQVEFDGDVKPDDVPRFDARTLVGLTLDEAVERARRWDCIVRVASRDGRGLPLTADERPDRVDVGLEDGVVVSVRPS